MSMEINRGKNAEQVIREYFARERELELQRRNEGSGASSGASRNPPPAVQPKVINAGDFLKLENIVCVDADGTVFESYPELYIAKDIVRKPSGNDPENKNPYQWVVYFEQQGLFLPSFALTCNILEALFRRKVDTEAKKVLDQYKNKSNGNGNHAQNTVVHFGTEKVIHYPSHAEYGQSTAVNASRTRRELSFSKSTLQDSLLMDALPDTAAARYVKQLTGLRDPSVLVEIGTYFSKPAKIWFPWNGQNSNQYTDTRAAWLGCSGNYFYLIAYLNLDYNDAARGVRLVAP